MVASSWVDLPLWVQLYILSLDTYIVIKQYVSLMAVWSKSVALTASYLSPLHRFECRSGHVRKVPLTWDWALLSAGYSSYLHHLHLACHDIYVTTIWPKSDNNQNFYLCYSYAVFVLPISLHMSFILLFQWQRKCPHWVWKSWKT